MQASELGMVQQRLDALPREARHVLHSASIFGMRFWTAGVASMLGQIGLPPSLPLEKNIGMPLPINSKSSAPRK